jgi:hypothetical protein
MGESIPAPTGTPHSPQALRWITRHPEVEISFPSRTRIFVADHGFSRGEPESHVRNEDFSAGCWDCAEAEGS